MLARASSAIEWNGGSSSPSSTARSLAHSAHDIRYFEEQAMTTANAHANDIRREFRRAVREHWVLFLIQGVVMVILGLFAIAVPVIATLAVDIYVGWLFLISGIVGIAILFKKQSISGFLWTLIAAWLALIVGVLLIWRPAAGVLTLTLLLVGFFIAEGIVQILAAFKYRSVVASSWGWLLFSGIVDLVLAAIILMGWPGTTAWTLGLLVGINLFMSGLALVMISLASRSSIETAERSAPRA
jgi:uncharacterized membrane protein HdeD (DUF308 family)